MFSRAVRLLGGARSFLLPGFERVPQVASSSSSASCTASRRLVHRLLSLEETFEYAGGVLRAIATMPPRRAAKVVSTTASSVDLSVPPRKRQSRGGSPGKPPTSYKEVSDSDSGERDAVAKPVKRAPRSVTNQKKKKKKRLRPTSSSEESSSEDDSGEDYAPKPSRSPVKRRQERTTSAAAKSKRNKPTRNQKSESPPSSAEPEANTKEAGDVGEPDVENEADTADQQASNYEKKGSLKIVSWNINGIRAWLPKGGLDYIRKEAPDVFCVQETKCSDDKLPKDMETLDGYKSYFLAGDKDGYSGVGVLTKIEPLEVTYGIGMEKHDAEGRVITLEFKDFFLVNAYVPNAGRGLVRLDYRMQWDKDFRSYLCKLGERKGVILTGDLNVAHQEIDLANPKTNKRNAGFTQEERDGLSTLLEKGFIDTFRKLYPDRAKAYTFWTYMMNARAKNVGWRLDYFIVSSSLMERVVDNEIRDKVMGSDHCPIVLHLK